MAWYNSSWTKRKVITNTGGTSGNQTDYQMRYEVTYDSDMASDFSDLRFTKADEVTLLDVWMESYIVSTSAVVWVETDTPANTVESDIYMYYGNSIVSSDWDGEGTFQFFDDFEIGDGTYSASRVAGASIGFNAAAPRIVIADNGTWLMVYRARADESPPTSHEGEVWIRNSIDSGETWSSGTKLSNDPYDAINAEFIKYPNGDIDIFYTQYDDSTSTHMTPNMVSRSTDNGSSWASFAACDSPLDSNTEIMWQDITIGTDVYLATYELQILVNGYDSKLYKTTDNGSTWTHVSNITTYAIDGNYVEPGMVYLGNGDFVAVLRSITNSDTIQMRSTDWGVTWSTDGYIKNDGSVAASGVGTDVVLHQCRIFNKDINDNDLGYIYMQAALYPGSYPRDMYAYISTDDCSSWESVDVIYTASDCHDSAITFKNASSVKYYPGKISGESNTTADNITISIVGTPSSSKWDVDITDVEISTDQAFVNSRSARLSGTGKLQKTVTHSDNIAIKYWAYYPNTTGTMYPIIHGDSTSRIYTVIGSPLGGDISYHDGTWKNTGVDIITGAWKSVEARDFNWSAHTQDILYDDTVIANDIGQRGGADNDDMLQISASGSTYYIDCVLIRKYVTDPATYIFGAEENVPTDGWDNKVINITSPGSVIAVVNASIARIIGI